MDKESTTTRTRRRIAVLIGSLMILALVVAPALAGQRISVAASPRHALPAAELNGADADEAGELESLLQAEDGDQDEDAQGEDTDDADENDTDDAEESDTDDGDASDSDDESSETDD